MCSKDKSIIEYHEAERYVVQKLTENGIAVLATCGNDLRVRARSMSIVNNGLDIFFQTDRRFVKSSQMRENPNVALCFNNIQIEGSAVMKGYARDESAQWFREEYRRRHRGSYEAYTFGRDTVLFQIAPQHIIAWRYDGNRSYRDFIDVLQRHAYREYYYLERAE